MRGIRTRDIGAVQEFEAEGVLGPPTQVGVYCCCVVSIRLLGGMACSLFSFSVVLLFSRFSLSYYLGTKIKKSLVHEATTTATKVVEERQSVPGEQLGLFDEDWY